LISLFSSLTLPSSSFKTKLTDSANKPQKASQLYEARLNDELGKVKEENREINSQQINPVAVN
jgi:hypothetical protein